MTDEATITVIATGLETAGANAAGKIVPKMQYQNTVSYTHLEPTGKSSR